MHRGHNRELQWIQRLHTRLSYQGWKGVPRYASRAYLRTMGHFRSVIKLFLPDAGTMTVTLLASPVPSWDFLVQQNGFHVAPPSDSSEMPVR